MAKGHFNQDPFGAAEPCPPFAADLSALVDGEVDETVARRLVVHLEICGKCKDFFTAMRTMASTHREIAQIAAGAGPLTAENPRIGAWIARRASAFGGSWGGRCSAGSRPSSIASASPIS